ncbi:MAG: metalloprotease PmbA [Gammaproteobacteria bacterium]|nr:metalloprotease PmbA [Gammaproteobacteria bacterium]
MKTISQNNPINTSKSTDQLREMMEDILNRAKKLGATDAAVGVNMDSGFSADVRMGTVETVAFSEDNSVGVTVYVDKAKGSASSSDTSPDALDAMVSAAYEIAKVSASDDCFGLPDPAENIDLTQELDLDHPWQITPEEAIEQALECESHARGLDPRIVNSDGVDVSTYQFCLGHADTQGFLGMIHATRHSISCSMVAQEEGSAMQRDYEYTTARHHDDMMSLYDVAKGAVTHTVERLGARKLKTQKAPILFSSRISGGLISSFIGAISGYNLYRKNSFLLDSMGQQLFPETIQMYERPWLKRGLGSALFDGEGVATRPNVILKDGILNQYVLSSYTARKMGLKTTANQGGVFNLTVDPTAGDLQDLLQTMGRGLLVTELMGQGVNILTGDYSRGACGFWVEDGKIQHPVEEITIAGNLKDMFRHIVAIGSDLNPNSSTYCGSILVEAMTIAGS